MYKYIKFNGKDYPNDRENGWSHEAQGVCHDDEGNWFFTQNGFLWKFPIGHDLNKTCEKEDRANGIFRTTLTKEQILGKETANSKEWKDLHLNLPHMGDIDYRDGYIFVPLEAEFGHIPFLPEKRVVCMVVFQAKTLSFVSTHVVKRENGKVYGNLWWVAINPNNGLLYTADGHITESSYVYVYRIGDVTKQDALTLHSKVTLWDENGNRLSRNHMQGGCFDGQNFLHLTNGEWTWKTSEVNYSKGTKGGIAVFKVSAAPREGGVERLYRISHSDQSGPFAFNFSGNGEEPEGLTYWDLDQDQRAPVIRGQLHVIMLDNIGNLTDDLYLKHYRRDPSSRHFMIDLDCGDELGTAGSAEIGIALFGTGNSTPYVKREAKYNYFDKNWKNHFTVEGGDAGELQQVELSILETSKADQLYVKSVNVTEVETGRVYRCPGNLWVRKVNDPLIRFSLKALPKVSNLGRTFLEDKDWRPGDFLPVTTDSQSLWSLPRGKVEVQWQRSPNGKNGWAYVAGWTGEPQLGLGVYQVKQEDVGCYIRALTAVVGYEDVLYTEPVKILKPSLCRYQDAVNDHLLLSYNWQEALRPGVKITAELKGVFNEIPTDKLSCKWRWTARYSDNHLTRSTGKTYTVKYDDLDGYIDLEIKAVGYDGSLISQALEIKKDTLNNYVGSSCITLSPENPKLGNTIKATFSGILTEIPAKSLHYAWQSSPTGKKYKDIDGQTGKTHSTTEDDVGKKLILKVTSDYYNGSMSSSPVTVVRDDLSAYQSKKLITLSPREPKPGEIITAKLSGILAKIAPEALHYEWQHRKANGAGIWVTYKSQPGVSYRPAESDMEQQIRLVITADNYSGALRSDPVTVKKIRVIKVPQPLKGSKQ